MDKKHMENINHIILFLLRRNLLLKSWSSCQLCNILGLELYTKDIQILILSDLETYGEYKPYHFVSSEKEFIAKVLDM